MIAFILVFVAGAANCVMDTLQFRKNRNIFPDNNWWNVDESWKNKWKDGDHTKGERFFGSSTFLVWTTDAWHFFQSVMLSCFVAAIMLYKPVFHWAIDLVILRSIFGISFNIWWRWVFVKEN
jgi:hypothetical protein